MDTVRDPKDKHWKGVEKGVDPKVRWRLHDEVMHVVTVDLVLDVAVESRRWGEYWLVQSSEVKLALYLVNNSKHIKRFQIDYENW